jgi:hypothetical protein
MDIGLIELYIKDIISTVDVNSFNDPVDVAKQYQISNGNMHNYWDVLDNDIKTLMIICSNEAIKRVKENGNHNQGT